MSDFQQPHAQVDGDKAVWADMLGHLVLIYATEYVPEIKTVHDATDAVRADIVILQGPQGQPIAGPDGHPPILKDTMIFPKALKSQTKGAVGGTPVLGRITQGEAKPGNSAPWLISNFTDQEAAYAQGYINAHPRVAPQQPAPVQQQAPAAWGATPPAAPQWGQQAPPPAAAPAPAWGQQPIPSAPTPAAPGWGQPQAPAAPVQQQWGQPAQSPTPPFGGPLNPALVAQLQGLNVPVDQIVSDEQARQIVQQLGQQPAA